MRSFRDAEGREWHLTVDVNAAKRVRSLAGVDLLDITGGLFDKLSDPITLCDVLYSICKPEADKRGVTDEEFGRGLLGDPIDSATEALLEELVDFFPSRRREFLRKLLERSRETQGRAFQILTTRLDDPRLNETIEKMLGDSSGSPPESLVSTPAH